MTNFQIKIPNTGRFSYFTQLDQLLGNIFFDYAEQFLFVLVRPSVKYDEWYGYVKIYHANPDPKITVVYKKYRVGLAFPFKISKDSYSNVLEVLQTACQIRLLSYYDPEINRWHLIINPEEIDAMPERGTVELFSIRLELF